MNRPGPLPYPENPPLTFQDLPAAGEGSMPRLSRRFGARLIDEVAIALPAFIALVLPFLVLADPNDPGSDVPPWATITAAVIPVVYEFLMTVVFGATLGKMALGMRIVSYADGSHPQPYQMGLRVLIPAAPALLAMAPLAAWLSGMLGTMEFVIYATLLFSPVGRGIYDKAAGTIVLRTE